jgi:2'-5' RNA ligase
LTVAIWLIPEEPARARLAEIIDRLSEEYHSPRFNPHLTLVHPIPVDSIEDRLTMLAEQTGDLELWPEEVATGDDFYHCVFVPVVLTERLIGTRQTAERVFSVPATPFLPHMSLIYADVEPRERLKIARGAGFSRPGPIRVAAIEAVDVSGPVEKWRVIARAVR